MRPDFLKDVLPAGCIRFEEPMRLHTSFRVGGPAEVLITPRDEDQTVAVIRELLKAGIPYVVIGRGTNLLVSDSGVRGAVVVLSGGDIELLNGGLIRAGAGVQLRQLCEQTLMMGLTGLEFASGIPGTVGGAVAMNAGAYGGEFSQLVHSVRLLDSEGRISRVPGAWMQFGYRTSIVQRMNLTILSADLRLRDGDILEGRRRHDELLAERRTKQPLDLPSAGSTFRRPEGAFAGTLIQACGLKGARAGGAMVSTKHAGFIVNADSASASDIYRLITEVRDVVYRATGFTLEPEVKFLGEFND